MHIHSTLEILIIAGPNGAGKTTFAEEFVAEQPRPLLSAARLNPSDPTQARLQAGRTFFAALDAHIRQGASFVVESTLAGQGFVRIMERLQEAGYTVVLAFLFLPSPEVCIERVAERVRGGGHDVPEEDIVRRYYRSKHNFWHVYRHKADRWHLYINTSDGFQLVATGEESAFQISDDIAFQQVSGLT